MCGLVGIAGDLGFKDEATMKRLLLLDYWRGPDSTGMAAIRTNGDAKLAKMAGTPIELFDMGRFKDALNGNASRVFIGHNRAATRGLINGNNAHPFHVDHIVGAHNGTLDKDSTDRIEKALGERFPVDSMALIAGIARLGLEETIDMCSDDGLSGTNGSAWSLVWYNQENGSLNFLRNGKRPLWYALTKDFKRLFWASEFPMIQCAVQMSNGAYELFTEEETFYRYRTTEENVHYEFDVAALKEGGDSRPKPKAKEVKGRKLKQTWTGNYGAGGSGGGSHDPFMRRDGGSNVVGFQRPDPPKKTLTTTVGSKTSSSTSSNKDKERIVFLESTPENPLANLVTPTQFSNMAKNGCSWCGESIHMLLPGLIIYERDDQVLCPKCSGSNQTRIYARNDLYL